MPVGRTLPTPGCKPLRRIATLALLAGLASLAPAQDRPATPFGLPLPAGMPFIPVGPQPAAVPPSSEAWRAVVARYGAPMKGRQAKVLEDVVAELSRAAGAAAPRGGYRATLLDAPVLNAFAIGDGNVFMTRQLLAHMNDEDELIGVMGHEVGHVLGGHSLFAGAAQASQSGSDRLIGAILPPLQGATRLGSTVVVQAFGRSQEHAADMAGVKFLADLGRDPMAMARALDILDAESRLQEKIYGARLPGALDYWLRSHPMHAERIGMVRMASSMAPRTQPRGPRRSAAEFVRQLDGMDFDDGAQQGIVDETRFRHPSLRFALDAAEGFTLRNGSSALLVLAPTGGSAALRLIKTSGTPAQRFQAAWERSFPTEIAVPVPALTAIGGIPGASGTTEMQISGVPVRFTMWLYEWSPELSFIYAAMDPKGAAAAQHAATAGSFRRLSEQEAAAVKVRRLQVVDVEPGDTVASLAARMAYADFQEDRFRLLNGMFKGQPLPTSGPIKLVVWAAQ